MHAQVADDEIKLNQKTYEHDGAIIGNENPLLIRYRYIESKGKKREWAQTEKSELTGTTSLKKVSQLTEAKAFMEAMGPGLCSPAIHSYSHTCTCMRMMYNRHMECSEAWRLP